MRFFILHLVKIGTDGDVDEFAEAVDALESHDRMRSQGLDSDDEIDFALDPLHDQAGPSFSFVCQ